MVNKPAKILIVDDDPEFCEAKSLRLKDDGFQVDTLTDAREALAKTKLQPYDLVITDLVMKNMSGLDLLKGIKKFHPDLEVMVITGFASIETAIEAIKSGAADYIAKSAPYQELLFKINKTLEKKEYCQKIEQLKSILKEKYSYQNIIGKAEKMQEIYNLIENISDTDVTILIRGETGTGKELIARAIHFNSIRKDKAFIIVNCAAISEHLVESELFGHEKGAFTGAIKEKPGKLELADGGTIFLDEIGDMSINLQAKLLRVLQDKKFERVGGTKLLSSDTRIISATNRDLAQLIKEGGFREDLFYRINVVTIELPPLRERKEDIGLLIDYFLNKFQQEFKNDKKYFSADAQRLLFAYHWPGNIRELENLIKKFVLIVKTNVISEADVLRNLPAGYPELSFNKETPLTSGWKKYMQDSERHYFESLLRQYQGRLKIIAQTAGINRKTLFKKMQQYGLKKENFMAED